MSSYNKIILMGNVTRDPALKQLASGTTVCEFGLAVSRKWKEKDSGGDREEVAFFDCAAFGRQAEVIGEYVRKGSPLFLDGRVKQDSWDDPKSGQKRSKLSVVVENFQLMGGKRDGEQEAAPDRPQSKPSFSRRSGGGGMSDADVPFSPPIY